MLLYLGSEVRLEKLVKLFVVVVGEVDAFLLAPVLAVQDQVGVVVEDPLDLDIGILVDTAPLLEELLDAGQPIQPSGIARDDLARLVSSPDRAMQRDQRERQRLPDHLCVLCSTRSCGSVDNQQVMARGFLNATAPRQFLRRATRGTHVHVSPQRAWKCPGAPFWNASSGMGKMPEVACEARVADGIFRGGALGLLWSVWFGPSECWSVQQPFRHNAQQLSKRTGMYVLGFSSFLACYNGLFCGCERSFGRDSAASPVAAGGLVGLAVGAMIPPVRVATMLSTAGMCAGLCGAGHAMGAVWRT